MRSLLIQFWHSNQEVTEAKSEGKSTKEQKNDCILIKKLWCFHFELPLYSDSHSGDAHVTAMFGQPWPKYEPAGLLAYINIKLRTFQLVMTKLKWQNTLIWTPGRAADSKCACAHLNPAFLQQTCCKLGPTKNHESQPTPHIPGNNLKFALFFCFFIQIYVIYTEWFSPGSPNVFGRGPN